MEFYYRRVIAERGNVHFEAAKVDLGVHAFICMYERE